MPLTAASQARAVNESGVPRFCRHLNACVSELRKHVLHAEVSSALSRGVPPRGSSDGPLWPQGREVTGALGVIEQSLRTWVKQEALDRRECDDGLTSAERECVPVSLACDCWASAARAISSRSAARRLTGAVRRVADREDHGDPHREPSGPMARRGSTPSCVFVTGSVSGESGRRASGSLMTSSNASFAPTHPTCCEARNEWPESSSRLTMSATD